MVDDLRGRGIEVVLAPEMGLPFEPPDAGAVSVPVPAREPRRKKKRMRPVPVPSPSELGGSMSWD
jgi:hypothetical protein